MIQEFIEKLSQQNIESIPLNGSLDLMCMGYRGHCLWKAKQILEEKSNGDIEPSAKFIVVIPKKNEK
jgi:hypothetical protein